MVGYLCGIIPNNSNVLLDAIASVAVHPLDSTITSVSGSRHFADKNSKDDSSVDSDSSASDSMLTTTRPNTLCPESRDTSIKLWHFPCRTLPVRYPTSTDPSNPQV